MNDIVCTPLITEKTSRLLTNHNQYVFYIPTNINKIEFSHFIKKHYKVDPTSVNILNVKGKTKTRPKKGSTSDRKKAIVTIKVGQTIEPISKLF